MRSTSTTRFASDENFRAYFGSEQYSIPSEVLDIDESDKLEDIGSVSSITPQLSDPIDEPVEERDEENGERSDGTDSPNEFHGPPMPDPEPRYPCRPAAWPGLVHG